MTDMNQINEDEQEDLSPNILTLTDEEGQEHQFELIDTLDMEEDTYTALIPYYESEEDMLMSDGQLLILKVVSDDTNPEEDYLEVIENEEEFNKVSELFVERLSEIYDIEE